MSVDWQREVNRLISTVVPLGVARGTRLEIAGVDLDDDYQVR